MNSREARIAFYMACVNGALVESFMGAPVSAWTDTEAQKAFLLARQRAANEFGIDPEELELPTLEWIHGEPCIKFNDEYEEIYRRSLPRQLTARDVSTWMDPRQDRR